MGVVGKNPPPSMLGRLIKSLGVIVDSKLFIAVVSVFLISPYGFIFKEAADVLNETQYNYATRQELLCGLQKGAITSLLTIRSTDWQAKYTAEELESALVDTVEDMNIAMLRIMLLFGKPHSDAFEAEVCEPLFTLLSQQADWSRVGFTPEYDEVVAVFQENRKDNYKVISARVKWWVDYMSALDMRVKAAVPSACERDDWDIASVFVPEISKDSSGRITIGTKEYSGDVSYEPLREARKGQSSNNQ